MVMVGKWRGVGSLMFLWFYFVVCVINCFFLFGKIVMLITFIIVILYKGLITRV